MYMKYNGKMQWFRGSFQDHTFNLQTPTTKYNFTGPHGDLYSSINIFKYLLIILINLSSYMNKLKI
jgi:hypothetical protein